MAKELTPAERQALKGRAHRLDPVVMIGAEGVSTAVLAEVERALKAHELIKIRVTGGDGATRERFLGEICAATDAAPVQHIGKILVVYRERPPGELPEPAVRRETARGRPRPSPRPSRGTPRRAKVQSR